QTADAASIGPLDGDEQASAHVDARVSAGLGDDERDAPRRAGDARRGAVPRAEAGGQLALRRQRFQVAAGGDDDAVRAYDERAVAPRVPALCAPPTPAQDRAVLFLVPLALCATTRAAP